jgi:hypothetical protein
MSAEVVDTNPYSRLMALQRMGVVKVCCTDNAPFLLIRSEDTSGNTLYFELTLLERVPHMCARVCVHEKKKMKKIRRHSHIDEGNGAEWYCALCVW